MLIKAQAAGLLKNIQT